MNKLLFLFIMCLVSSCQQEEKIRLKEGFVFTTTTKSEKVLSLKFFKDTMFVAWDYPKNDFVYYILLNAIEIDSINYFLDNTNFNKYHKEYYQEGLRDGALRQFEFHDSNKNIIVYGYYELEEIRKINSFSNFISQLYFSRRKHGFRNRVYFEGQEIYWNKDVNFGNVDRFLIPEMPQDFQD